VEKTMFDTLSEQRRSGRQAKEIKVKIDRNEWDKIALLARYAGCPLKYVPNSIVSFAVKQALKDFEKISETSDFRRWKAEKGLD